MPLTAASCRRIALTAAIALHVCVLVQALVLERVAAPQSLPPQPILVQWITPPRVEPPKPAPAPAPPPEHEPKPVPEHEPKPVPEHEPKPVPAHKPKPVARREPKPAPEPERPQVPRPQPALLLAAAETPAAPEAPAVEPPPPSAPPAADSVATAPAPEPAPAPVVAPAPPPPVSPPRFDAAYLENPPPAYPAQSRRLGETGRVVLRVLVTAAGVPERVELRTSSGSHRLDGAALRAVQRWKFVPARQGDTPVSAWVLVPILFTLEG